MITFLLEDQAITTTNIFKYLRHKFEHDTVVYDSFDLVNKYIKSKTLDVSTLIIISRFTGHDSKNTDCVKINLDNFFKKVKLNRIIIIQIDKINNKKIKSFCVGDKTFKLTNKDLGLIINEDYEKFTVFDELTTFIREIKRKRIESKDVNEADLTRRKVEKVESVKDIVEKLLYNKGLYYSEDKKYKYELGIKVDAIKGEKYPSIFADYIDYIDNNIKFKYIITNKNKSKPKTNLVEFKLDHTIENGYLKIDTRTIFEIVNKIEIDELAVDDDKTTVSKENVAYYLSFTDSQQVLFYLRSDHGVPMDDIKDDTGSYIKRIKI